MDKKELNMTDAFDIRVEIYPETPTMTTLFSFWKGQVPIVNKMPLQQAVEHFREYLENIAEDMGEKEEGDPDECDARVDLLTKELYEAINRVRQDAATHHRCIWNLGTELHNELWEYVRLQWDDDEMWQQYYRDLADDPLHLALHGGRDPLSLPEPKASSLREYLAIICGGMEKTLLKKAEEYEAKKAAEAAAAHDEEEDQ